MPELPEVEVTRQGLLPVLPGRRIMGVSGSGKRLRAQPPAEVLRTSLAGALIRAIDRRAKYLLADLSSGEVLLSAHYGRAVDPPSLSALVGP